MGKLMSDGEWLRIGGALIGLCLVAACGARSGLEVPDAGVTNGAPGNGDAFGDGSVPLGCPDAGSTLVYLMTQERELFSFFPPTSTFRKIGNVACAASTPYSMAVNRQGVAYSVFRDGHLYAIDTASAACKLTQYLPPPSSQPFFMFGMGYAGDQLGESLYVCDADFRRPSAGLATIDTESFSVSLVGRFDPELPRCELTGTGDGRLFAFCLAAGSTSSRIVELDRFTAKQIAVHPVRVGGQGDGFAFAFWGGYFWIFTSPGGTSTVT
jgi:hypothetical protein